MMKLLTDDQSPMISIATRNTTEVSSLLHTLEANSESPDFMHKNTTDGFDDASKGIN
jgi:hypothetical protein